MKGRREKVSFNRLKISCPECGTSLLWVDLSDPKSWDKNCRHTCSDCRSVFRITIGAQVRNGKLLVTVVSYEDLGKVS